MLRGCGGEGEPIQITMFPGLREVVEMMVIAPTHVYPKPESWANKQCDGMQKASHVITKTMFLLLQAFQLVIFLE